ncbi:unnamed protein product, partial [Amoebophrya sp. A25]|eukprot:GSA25T00006196001.1
MNIFIDEEGWQLPQNKSGSKKSDGLPGATEGEEILSVPKSAEEALADARKEVRDLRRRLRGMRWKLIKSESLRNCYEKRVFKLQDHVTQLLSSGCSAFDDSSDYSYDKSSSRDSGGTSGDSSASSVSSREEDAERAMVGKVSTCRTWNRNYLVVPKSSNEPDDVEGRSRNCRRRREYHGTRDTSKKKKNIKNGAALLSEDGRQNAKNKRKRR